MLLFISVFVKLFPPSAVDPVLARVRCYYSTFTICGSYSKCLSPSPLCSAESSARRKAAALNRSAAFLYFRAELLQRLLSAFIMLFSLPADAASSDHRMQILKGYRSLGTSAVYDTDALSCCLGSRDRGHIRDLMLDRSLSQIAVIIYTVLTDR